MFRFLQLFNLPLFRASHLEHTRVSRGIPVEIVWPFPAITEFTSPAQTHSRVCMRARMCCGNKLITEAQNTCKCSSTPPTTVFMPFRNFPELQIGRSGGGAAAIKRLAGAVSAATRHDRGILHQHFFAAHSRSPPLDCLLHPIN